MSRLIDMTGQRFGRLTVLYKAPPTGGQAEWICQCSCENITKVKGGHLRNGAIQSCGCYKRKRAFCKHNHVPLYELSKQDEIISDLERLI